MSHCIRLKLKLGTETCKYEVSEKPPNFLLQLKEVEADFDKRQINENGNLFSVWSLRLISNGEAKLSKENTTDSLI